MDKKSRSIKVRYILSGLAICLVSLFLVSLTSYMVSHRITAQQSNIRFQETALKNAAQLDSWFQQYGKIIEGLAEDIEITGNYNDDFLFQLMKGKMNIHNKSVMDFYIGFEDGNRKLVSGTAWIPSDGYDCRTRVWYKEAMVNEGVVYTEPYVDAQTGKMVITVAKMLKKNERPIGVLAADIVVSNIIDVVQNYNLNEASYAFLLDSEGNILTHREKKFLPNSKGLKNIEEVSGTDYSKLARTLKSDKLEMIDMVDYDGQSKRFILSKIESCGWFFGIAIMKSEYEKPLNYLLYGFVFALLLSAIVGVSIMLKLINHMVEPIKSLSDTVKSFSVGNMDVRTSINTKDEIGELGQSFNNLADIIQEYSISLEKKVAERTKELEEKNNNIMESIDYAERLQRAIIPSLPQRLDLPAEKCFAVWKPKDLVGGDMYWCRGDKEFALLAVADCTGHGVPGALMTMALSSILDGLPRNMESNKPSETLNVINSRLKETLGQDKKDSLANDGADVGLCLIDKVNRKLYFSGAKISLYVISQGTVTEYKGTRYSVGYSGNKEVFFEDHQMDWMSGSVFYMTTDGLLDQNIQEGKGGLGRAGFIKFLESISNSSFCEQKVTIEALVAQRISVVEQRDDITIVGIEA